MVQGVSAVCWGVVHSEPNDSTTPCGRLTRYTSSRKPPIHRAVEATGHVAQPYLRAMRFRRHHGSLDLCIVSKGKRAQQTRPPIFYRSFRMFLVCNVNTQIAGCMRCWWMMDIFECGNRPTSRRKDVVEGAELTDSAIEEWGKRVVDPCGACGARILT